MLKQYTDCHTITWQDVDNSSAIRVIVSYHLVYLNASLNSKIVKCNKIVLVHSYEKKV